MMLPTISLRIEKWKFNKEYGVYVSTLGNFKDRHKRNLPFKLNNGYCYVETETGGWKSAHRLVLFTWKPIPNAEDLTVDHKNHNKRDNSIGNLQWVTKEENLRRAKEDELAFKKEKKITIKDKNAEYIIIDTTALKEEKKRRRAERKSLIAGYSLDGEGCYTKEEIINKLLAIRPSSTRKNTKKYIDALENGKNETGSKTFGKHTVRHVVAVVFKEI